MRRLVTLLLLLVMIAGLAGEAYAAQTGITLTDGSGQPGDTVYLAVSLKETVTGDSIGISYSYDPAVLEAVPGSCYWNVSGVLQDFNDQNQGVWAAGQGTKLTGTLCVLAFRILPNANFTECDVSCTVYIQNNAKEVGNYTAQSTIFYGCSHKFGDWQDAGSVGHSRVCPLCQDTQTQSHIRDNGIVKENTESTQTDWKVYTCTVCGAKEQVVIPKEHTYPDATEPQESLPPIHTAPTEPEQGNRPDSTQPTNPNQSNRPSQDNQENQNNDPTNPFRDYNTPSTGENGDHQHSSDQIHDGMEEEAPLIIPANQDNSQADPHSGHDHSADGQVVSRQERQWNILLVVVILAAMIGGGTYYLKKKK